jgi:general secretion pathway protein G
MTARYARKGFTLIEILIVVIILGILAAIVIPQFSSASNDARKSSLASTAQTLRSQVALYRLQHNDVLPGLKGSAFDSPTFWTQMTTATDATGVAYVAGTSTSGPFGPYMQTTPTNPLAAGQSWQSTVTDGTSSTVPSAATGFVFDFSGGSGSLWGTDSTGKAIVP